MSRIVLKSANTAVILADSPAFKTTDESGSLFAGVTSANFGFSSNRQSVGQVGNKDLAVDDIIGSPDVNLSLNYNYSPTYCNEDLMGLSFSLNEKSELSLISILKDRSYNFYFYNNPDQGQDGIETIQTLDFPLGGEIISFGNAYLTKYAMDFQVGSYPSVSVDFLCSNVESEKYYGTNIKSPAINLESGNASGVGNFDITKTQTFASGYLGGTEDLDRAKLTSITPSELTFVLQDLEIGGQKLSPGNHILNSFKFEADIKRANYYKLGSNYVCGRDIEYPVNARISISSLVDSYENGFISGLLQGEVLSYLDIAATDCNGVMTSKLFFENLKIENVQYNMLLNQSMSYSLDLSLKINDEEGFKTYITEEDWKATRVYDEFGSITDSIYDNVIPEWKINDDAVYSVRFADYLSYEVGDRAFYDCNNIYGRLFFPRNINYIGESSFENCTEVRSLYFDTNHSIETIGASGFKGCTGIVMEDLLFPLSLNTLSNSSFEGCFNLKGFDLNEISYIGDKSFYNCSGAEQPISFMDGLFYLGESAFENCVSLGGSLEFPDSLDYIPKYAFKNCGSLQYDLVINNSISGIGAEAFYQCSGLNGELTLSESLTYIESGTFYNCSSITGDLIIPSSVSGVGDFAFFNLAVDSLFLPDSLQYISNGSFERLRYIKTDLALPSTIISIGDRAFADCDGFQEALDIPSGIQSIGDEAFKGCDNIKDIYINSPISIFQGQDAFKGIQGCLYVTPIHYRSYIDNLVDGKFQGMPVCLGALNSIVYDALDYSVIKQKRGIIPSDWYSNQTRESLLVIGRTCRGIEANAFVDSVGLVGGLGLTSGVKYIGQNAFRNCSFSGDLIIDDKTTELGSGAFEGCSGFDGNLQIPYFLEGLYENTFKDCRGLTSPLILPPRVSTIEDSVFENCYGLNGTVSLPAQCEYIGARSFANCGLLSGGLVFPQALLEIGDQAFLNCSSLNGELDFNRDLQSIGDSGFYNCYSLSGFLELPNGLSYLGEYAFYNCYGFFGPLILPNSIEYINKSVFENCSGFDGDLWIPQTTSGIGDRAFYNCTGFDDSLWITDIAAQNIGTDAFFGADFFTLIVHDNVVDISIGEFDYFKTTPMNLILQNGLVSVSDYAFQDYAFFGNFELPLTVLNIGISAFENVDFNGEYLFQRGNVTGIGARAFKGITQISGDLIFPDSLTYIGDEAFRDNNAVDGFLDLPNFIETIGEYAFAGCNSLIGSIILPNSLSGLGQYAFLDCSSLNGSLSISTNPALTEIATGTFKNCSSLTGEFLVIPDNITNIEFQAFKNCFGLTGTITITDIAALSLIGKDALDESDFQHLIVSDFVQEISDGEFDYFQNRDLSLTLSQTITGILDNSFDNYAITGEIIFPEGLLEIGNSAFKFCDGLIGALIIPESLSGIGDSAFEECRGFQGDLTLPIGLPSVGARTFYNCVGLDGTLTISDFTASSVSLGDDTFFGTNFTLLRAESYDGTISDTEFDTLAQFFTGSLEIGQSASRVGNDAFDNYSFLGDFFSSGTLASIDDRAFLNVQFRGNFDPQYVTSIGNDSFKNCGFDGTASFYSNTESIGDRAFQDCGGLIGDLKLKASVISIGDYAFENCTGFNGEFILSEDLVPITDPSIFSTQLKTVGEYAFSNCTGLTGNLIIPADIESIGQYAFSNCKSLDGFLYIGSGLTEIADSTFRDCQSLTVYNGELLIPTGTTNIGSFAFAYCSSLNGSLKITKTAAQNIGTNAFLNTNFDNITVLPGASFIDNGDFDYFSQTGISLTLNDDLVDIRDYAFDDYNFVGNLIIPTDPGVSGIGKYAFKGNGGFVGDLVIPYQTRIVGDFAFFECDGFTSLSFENYEFSRVDVIGSGAFKGCSSLGNQLLLPSPLEVIKSGAFQDCTGLTGLLTIPDNLDEIGEHAFKNCTGISGVFIDTLRPEVFTVEQGAAFDGVSDYLYLGVLVYNDYKILSTQIGDDFWFQGLPISGVGASKSVFYTGADLDYNILNREEHAFIDVVTEGQSYVIPERWQDNTARLNAGIGANTPMWLDVGSLCEEIQSNAFDTAYKMQGSLNLGGDLRIIGDFAFRYNGIQPANLGLTGLTFGNSLEVVKTGAFYSCYNLRSDLVFQSNVTGIEEEAFYNCNKIPSVTFLDGIQEIGDKAFRYCAGLTGAIDFPSTLDVIGDNCFENCTSLEEVNFSNPNLAIGAAAFRGGFKIETINLPAQISSLGSSAFQQCSIATGSITLPSTLDVVSSSVFRLCPKIGALYLNGQHIFGSLAFDGCTDLNKDIGGSLVIPQEVVSNNGYISQAAFRGCENIKNVTFPNNFSGVNHNMSAGFNGTFQNCYGLEDVTYGVGLDVVKYGCFNNCTSLNNIVNPDWPSLTGIESYAFYKTAALPSIYIPGNVTEIGDGAFSMGTAVVAPNLTTSLLIEPSGNLRTIGNSAFRARKITETFLPDVPPVSGFDLGDDVYRNCDSITPTISIPESVLSMGLSVFRNCSSALNFTWPSNLTSIPNNTFRDCSSFEAIDIPSVVTSVGDYAFYNCAAATGTIEIHSDITEIGRSAFQFCENIEQVLFNNTNVITIEFYLFNSCSRLSGNNGSITINNVDRIKNTAFNSTAIDFINWTDINQACVIDQSAFRGNDTLTGMALPSGLVSINGNAFDQTSSLITLDFSDTNLKTIGVQAFDGSAATGYNFNNGELLDIRYYAFRNSNIEYAVIPDPVNSVGFAAFSNCTNLKEINFSTTQLTTFQQSLFQSSFYFGENTIIMPENLDTVEYSCFQTSNISGVVDFSNTNLSTIGYQAFYNCDLLEAVKFPSTLGFIARDMFELSNNLVWVSGDGTTELENDVFKDCPNFSGFVGAPSGLPPSLKVIGNDNFVRCGNIKPRQNYLISGNIESIGNFNWYQQTSTQSLIIHDSFSGSIGNSNWRDVGNLSEISILFDNANGTIGSENWIDCNLINNVYINCPYSAWVGTNNFSNASSNINIFIKSTYFNDYTVANDWSGQQGVNPQGTISSYPG